MKRPVIISIGEVLWDLFPLPQGERFGGAPANFACHAALGNGEVTMVSAIGDDNRGREATSILRHYGINTSLVQVVRDAPTGTVGVELDDNGKPTYEIHENAAWDRLEFSDKHGNAMRTADAVYFGTLGQRSEMSRQTTRRCLEEARQADVPRILDINLRAPFFDEKIIRESVQLASIVKTSDDELAQLSNALGIAQTNERSTLRTILEHCSLDQIVMTRGENGAMLVSKDDTVVQPGIPAKIRDTVGAGDAFTAAFALGLLRGEAIPSVLGNACQLASNVCTLPGAVPSISQ